MGLCINEQLMCFSVLVFSEKTLEERLLQKNILVVCWLTLYKFKHKKYMNKLFFVVVFVVFPQFPLFLDLLYF